MTTVTEDNQLTLELQELYCIGKDWIADLNTLNTGLSIQQRLLFENAISKKKPGNNENIAEIRIAINNIENRYVKIKKDIERYLNILGPLINKSNQNYELALIENHALLEHKTSALFYAYIEIKETISKFLQN